MPLTSGDYAAALKINYLPPLNDQVYHAHVMLNRLEKNNEDVDGEFAYVPLVTGRNPGVGARGGQSGGEAAGGAGPKLPAAGKLTYNKLTYKMINHYGRGSVTGPSMRASKSKQGAFEKNLDREMKGLSESLPDQLNNMIWSYGHGRYATLTAATTVSTSVTFTCDATSHFRLKVGDRVHLCNLATGAMVTGNGGSTVDSITLDSSSGVHTVITAAHLSPGAAISSAIHAIYQGGNPDGTALTVNDSSIANEMYGIPGLVDDGDVGADEAVSADAQEFDVGALTIGGINRANTSILQSINLTNPNGAGTNRPLTYGLLEQAYLRATIEGANEDDIEIYTNTSLWATLGILNIGNRTFNDSMKRVDPGFTALDFNGSPVFRDRDAPRDIMWFLDMSTLMLLTQTDYQFLDEDGGSLRNVANYDVWEFSLVRDVQLGIRNFRKNVMLNDLTSAVTIEGTNY